MARRPIELPPEAAQEFMRDMEAYFAATTGLDKEAIAARQLRVLRDYLRPSDGKLRVSDVRELFEAMREEKGANKKPGRREHPRGRARR